MLMCVFMYTVNIQTRRLFFFFLHVLFTPATLLRTAMETEFGIQVSLLSGDWCMSVSDLKLFRGASFCLADVPEALITASAHTTLTNPLY